MEQRDFSPMIYYRAGAFNRQTRDYDHRRHGQNQFAGSGMGMQRFPGCDGQKKRENPRDEKKMFFRFHEEIVGEWPWSFQNQYLLRRIEVNVEISAAYPRRAHADRRHKCGCANSSRVAGGCVERFNEHPQSGQTPDGAESGVGKKNDVTGCDIQSVINAGPRR